MNLNISIADLMVRVPKADLKLISGQANTLITSIGSYEAFTSEDLIFVWTLDALRAIQASSDKPGAMIVSSRLCAGTEEWGLTTVLTAPRADLAFVLICEALDPHSSNPSARDTFIHPTAVIHPSASIGHGVHIGPYCVVEESCVLGTNATLGAHVVLEANVTVGSKTQIMHHACIHHDTKLGERVVIKPGAIVGSNGFGFIEHEGRRQLIPHIGNVIIEDDVQIGANSCIDRAKYGSTIIGRGTKLDNLCHIGHNVQIGQHCVMVAQFGAGGSSKVGDRVMAGGQTGLYDHVTVPSDCALGLRAAVTKSITKKGIYAGIPQIPLNDYLKSWAVFKQLPQLKKDIQTLKNETRDKPFT